MKNVPIAIGVKNENTHAPNITIILNTCGNVNKFYPPLSVFLPIPIGYFGTSKAAYLGTY